jgi:acetylornithine deacetylase/succinyl-diaminopimelate desuccinylase-like protein
MPNDGADFHDSRRLFDACEAGFPEVVRRLSDLVRIPSCAFPGFPREPVEESARATARWFSDIGMPDVRIVALPDAPSAVVARDHRAGPGKPTLLLYAHHDVQPPLREPLWTAPAFEPVVREGRLYGRGAADDKAGIALHAASIAAWYATGQALPVNVTVLVEGEEETGSNHLEDFIREHLDLLRADAVVIADLSNFDTGLPSLTVSLRGLVAVEVELVAMERSVHSGLWGNTVPDVVGELCRILASLRNPDGSIAVEGILDGIEPPTPSELADWARLPYDRAAYASVPGFDPRFVPVDSVDLGRKLWRTPALTINGIQSGAKGTTGNVLMDRAWSRLGVRIVPGMDPRRTLDLLVAHLRARVPEGMTLSVSEESRAPAWGTSTTHPIFAHARAALEAGYGRAPVEVGCGATIPFVESVTAALGGVPALLVGVEDPACNAHSEDESVHLGDLLSAIRGQAELFRRVGGA